jgi:hypothetical protein
MSPIQNSEGVFDDKMIVEDASDRGEKRGVALPLLLDLARKPYYLHDASVATLESLLDENRGERAPHPFYITNANERNDVVQFLKGLDTRSAVLARRIGASDRSAWLQSGSHRRHRDPL